ncbi:MAG: response regulator transcription factor [Eubacteriales bacterium]|nr:response regulator transcription factor [Eubacteriales bacterium]
MQKILICEDDNAISDVLARLLKRHAYQIEQAYSGTEALRLLNENAYDLVLLDLMLPGLSGEEILAERESGTPVIVVSAKGSIDDRLTALRLGADDYIQKPFHNEELILRIQAVLRRSEHVQTRATILKFADLSLDKKSLEFRVAGEIVELTNYEFRILEQLMSAPKRVFTKSYLYRKIWGYDDNSEENVINIHVSNIRKKLKQRSNKEYIKTVWGLGIKLNDTE